MLLLHCVKLCSLGDIRRQSVLATAQLMAHLLFKMGPKMMVRNLPHAVEDLEKVVIVDQELEWKDSMTCKTRYTMLSIIVLIPLRLH